MVKDDGENVEGKGWKIMGEDGRWEMEGSNPNLIGVKKSEDVYKVVSKDGYGVSCEDEDGTRGEDGDGVVELKDADDIRVASRSRIIIALGTTAARLGFEAATRLGLREAMQD
ncbi:hypothetical protein VNO77_34209 [Canavalia gladiata]|uniref:Uncharacterized protein n=1 Tax=Canavalia gladiata TaxID=3824 RepID=A0AAN9KG60_CANGL